jgi:hypothetical protein
MRLALQHVLDNIPWLLKGVFATGVTTFLITSAILIPARRGRDLASVTRITWLFVIVASLIALGWLVLDFLYWTI